MKGAPSLTQNMKLFYGPNDFVANTTHPNQMKIVLIDEAGTFYIEDGLGGYNKTYILVCVKLLTYKSHLIPLPQIDTLLFVRALEKLQAI